MGELLDELSLAVVRGPHWDIGRLTQRLAPHGVPAEEVRLMCGICAPQHKRGLRQAVVGLLGLCPDDPTVRNWAAVLASWSSRDRAVRALLDARPFATYSPVARYLAEVAGALPLELATALLQRMLQLVNAPDAGENTAYTLYLSAKHLTEQRAVNRSVALGLLSGDFDFAIHHMAPASVHEPEVLEAYKAALRNALGHRKVATPQRPQGIHPSSAAQKKPQPEPSEPQSLRAALALVPTRDEADNRDEDSADPEEKTATGRRKPTGLTTAAALGIPRGLLDLDAVSAQVLISRLGASDLDARSKWLYRVALNVMYCTGWPASLLAALGRDGDAVDAAGIVTFSRDSHPALSALDIDQVEVRVASELCRQLRSVVPCHVDGPHVRQLLRLLGAPDTVPTTMAMLRGAIWYAGRELGWSPEWLAIATCSWDPAFANDSHYLALPARIDLRPLHEHMRSRLRETEQQPKGLGQRELFASV